MQVRRTTALAVTLAVAATAALTAQGSVVAKPAKRADLVVSTVAAPPATAQPGASISAKATVASKGRVAAGASSVQFYLSKDKVRSADDVAGGTAKVKKLKPKKKLTATASVAVPQDASGSYYVVACADSRKKVKEAKEGNNCRTSTTPVAVDGDIHGKLTGELTFRDSGQTTDARGEVTTWDRSGNASILMAVDGNPADPTFSSSATGPSTFTHAGLRTEHYEWENCVQHEERKESATAAFKKTGDPFYDEIYGSIGKTDLSELSLVLTMRYTWTETETDTGRGEEPCDARSKTTTGSDWHITDMELKQISRTGNTIRYQPVSWRGDGQGAAAPWPKVEGVLTLTLE